MKNSKTTSRYMKSAAAFESKTPLFSEDELRSLLDNAALSSSPVRVTKTPTLRRNIMIGSGILAGAYAAFVLYSTMLQPTLVQNTIAANNESSNKFATMQTSKDPAADATDAALSSSTHKDLVFLKDGDSVSGQISAIPAPVELRYATSPASTAISTSEAKSAIPSKIKGLRAIEITRDEDLKALGIERSADGYRMIAELGYDVQDPVALQAFASNNGKRQVQTSFKQENLAAVLKGFGYADRGSMKFSVQLDSFALRSTLQQASVEAAACSPLLITHEVTDALGKEHNSVLLFGNSDHNASQNGNALDESAQLFDLYNPAPKAREQELSKFPLLSKLVAVRLPLMDAKGVGADLVLWYYPSENFISRLPKSVGEALRSEIHKVELAEQRNAKDSTPPTIEQRERGEYRYTDVARAASGSIEILSIGPNPATDAATIRFRLSDDRDLSFVLYDMAGNRVAILGQGAGRNSGEHTEQLDCHTLQSGAYLLSIVSNQGEQAVQRFIIQK